MSSEVIGHPSSTERCIRVIHQLGRNGGTVIAQCLAVMRNSLLLSEVHPFSQGMSNGEHEALWQSYKWFELFTSEEYADLSKKGLSFTQSMRLIYELACQRGLHLLVRDWSYLDFVSVPLHPDSTFTFSTCQQLPAEIPLIRTALIRHPLQQYCSMMQLELLRHTLTIDRFAYGYRRFAEKCQGIPHFRYEDFCDNPVSFLKKLCECLALRFDESFSDKWRSYNNITGCLETRRSPRILGSGRLHPVQLEMLAQFERNSDYRAAVRLFGYEAFR